MATFYTFGVLMLAALTSASINITSPPITNWGVWGNFQRCPFGRVAQGFQLKTEPNQYFGDDTALNAIRLFCGDPYRPDTAVITSTVGDFGEWGNVYTCHPGVLTGFQLRVESNRQSGDDTATNNARFWCTSLGNPNDYIEGDGMSWGDWSEPRHCYSGQAISGIQTQVEPYQGDADDTMLNNVMMECNEYVKPEADILRVKQIGENPPVALSPKFAALLRASNENQETPVQFNNLFKTVLKAMKKEDVKSAQKAKSTENFAVTVNALAQALHKAQKNTAASAKANGKEAPTPDFAVLVKAFSQVLNMAKENASAKEAKTSKDFALTFNALSQALNKAQENAAAHAKKTVKATPNSDLAVFAKVFSQAVHNAQEKSLKNSKASNDFALTLKTLSQALNKVKQENSSKKVKANKEFAVTVKTLSKALHKAEVKAAKTASAKPKEMKELVTAISNAINKAGQDSSKKSIEDKPAAMKV